jgi:hypothetical protein
MKRFRIAVRILRLVDLNQSYTTSRLVAVVVNLGRERRVAVVVHAAVGMRKSLLLLLL